MTQTVSRRTFLRGVAYASVVGLAGGAALLKPTRAIAAGWPAAAFQSKAVADALKALYGTSATTESASVKLEAPLQAENGAAVTITVSASIAGVESLAVLVDKNPNPLAFELIPSGAEPYVKLRVKMGQSSDVLAVAKAGGKLHVAKQNVKVTAGGCGG